MKMENQNNQNSIDSRLQNEKTNIPSLSELYKHQLTQKILDSAQGQTSSKNIVKIFPYRYFVVAALVILSMVILFLNQPNEEVVKVTNPVVKTNPPVIDSQMVKILAEKLNPDQIGDYANLLLTADAGLSDKYQAEIKALGTLSTRIVSSFYDDFKPVKNTKDN